ncbi:MAG: amidase [Anaerolineales bacterium]|nr:amidase [Anaerolineales bacterium]
MDGNQSVYDIKSAQLPYLHGFGLRMFVKALGWPVVGRLLVDNLLATAGIKAFRQKQFTEEPTLMPIHFADHPVREYAVPHFESKQVPESIEGFRFATAADFHQAYLEAKFSPLDVAERVIVAVEDSNQQSPPLRAVIATDAGEIRQQAEASAARYLDGNPLSPIDGVPVAVKDEIDLAPYPTTVGTAFLGDSPARSDATVAGRLRAMGALLIGKTNMHEIGINVTGLNPHHGIVRNPYSTAHYSGGSSSGSGSAVAAGLCPVAIGADGGGSIRIPSAFCGVVGIKSTFGRISEHGAFPLCWSVAHIGPLAATTRDAALAWQVIAGPDPLDRNTRHQPAPEIGGWDQIDLSQIRIGVFWPWFRHASADIVAANQTMLAKYQSMGAQIVDIQLPDLEAARVAHIITITAEMSQSLRSFHHHFEKHGLDVKTNLLLARSFTAEDYVQAQRVRTRLMAHFAAAFEQVDVIATPSVGLAAPPIKPHALPDGDSDVTVTTEIMRFAQPANLTGLPAISFPVGYNQEGLPLSMQLMGRPWDEKTLFGMALRAEQVTVRQKPTWHYDLFGD